METRPGSSLDSNQQIEKLIDMKTKAQFVMTLHSLDAGVDQLGFDVEAFVQMHKGKPLESIGSLAYDELVGEAFHDGEKGAISKLANACALTGVFTRTQFYAFFTGLSSKGNASKLTTKYFGPSERSGAGGRKSDGKAKGSHKITATLTFEGLIRELRSRTYTTAEKKELVAAIKAIVG